MSCNANDVNIREGGRGEGEGGRGEGEGRGGGGEGRISITVLNHYNVISLTMNVNKPFYLRS